MDGSSKSGAIHITQGEGRMASRDTKASNSITPVAVAEVRCKRMRYSTVKGGRGILNQRVAGDRPEVGNGGVDDEQCRGRG